MNPAACPRTNGCQTRNSAHSFTALVTPRRIHAAPAGGVRLFLPYRWVWIRERKVIVTFTKQQHFYVMNKGRGIEQSEK